MNRPEQQISTSVLIIGAGGSGLRTAIELAELLVADGPENVRWLQRAIRDIMTERAGVVRSGDRLVAGRTELSALEARLAIAALMRDVTTVGNLVE